MRCNLPVGFTVPNLGPIFSCYFKKDLSGYEPKEGSRRKLQFLNGTNPASFCLFFVHLTWKIKHKHYK